MKYNLVSTDNIVDEIYKINSITKDELEKEYDFKVNDEVILKFRDILLAKKDDKYLIVGDYDCDGICATTIIKKLLTHLNISSNYIIPSRIKDGYGLNRNIVKMASENGFDSLILVDNGIVSNDEIELAYSLGLKVYIIDHHEYDILPKAEAIIHSNIVDTKYHNLSAGGLACVLALSIYFDELTVVLGGLSTLSDMMKVTGFNRYLMNEMMKLLKKGDIYQLNLLNDNNPFNYENLSFNVIPKINSLSRMEPMSNANHLVKFLLADEKSCKEIVEQINYVNEKRKLSSKSMAKEAMSKIDDSNILVITSCDFMEGLCGLIANRMIYTVNRPVIILTLTNGYYKGSGRSYGNFNLYDALSGFDNYDSFGGHDAAVGISFKEEYFEEFKDYISSIDYYCEEIAEDVLLVEEDLINNDLLKQLEDLKPFGDGFKCPLFAISNNDYKKIIVANRFPKYLIRKDLSAICFEDKRYKQKAQYFIGRIKKDNYHRNSIQFSIEDFI